MISFLLLLLVVQACQVFLKENKEDKYSSYGHIDTEMLFGVWENTINNTDAPPSISAIKFGINNDFIFYPALGYGNNICRSGKYGIVLDTLSLKFNTENHIEKYIINFSAEELNVTPITSIYSQYSLANSRLNTIFRKKDVLDSYYLENFIEE